MQMDLTPGAPGAEEWVKLIWDPVVFLRETPSRPRRQRNAQHQARTDPLVAEAEQQLRNGSVPTPKACNRAQTFAASSLVTRSRSYKRSTTSTKWLLSFAGGLPWLRPRRPPGGTAACTTRLSASPSLRRLRFGMPAGVKGWLRPEEGGGVFSVDLE